VRRRQAQALRRQQVDVRVVPARGWCRQVLLHGGDDVRIRVRTRHGQHLRVAVQNLIRLGAEAAGHNDPAVLGQRLADGVERFLLGGVDEAAGVHDHQIGAVVAAGQLIPTAAQLGHDALGIHQRLGAAQADEADLGGHIQRREEGREGRRFYPSASDNPCCQRR
jgi:hypothetical protein